MYAGQVERSIDADIVLLLQRLLRDINPYVQSFKTCRERLLDDEASHPLQTINVRIIQHDPRRADRGTHNRPTSSEVACITIAPPDGTKGPIARDIRIEVKGGGLMRVPEWHSSYMALRYILPFPYGEQSWYNSLPLRGHDRLPEGHLFATRRLNMRQGTTQHHGIYQDPDRPEHGDGEEEPEGDGAAPRGRGGSTRVTRSQIYRYWLQVSPFHDFQTSALALVKLRFLVLYIFM